VNNEEGKQEEMPAAGNLQEGAETAADDVQMEDADGAQVGEGATNGTGGGATDENGDPSVNGAETQAATQQQPSDNPYAVNGTQQPAIPTVVRQQRDEALFLLLLSMVHAFVRPQEVYSKQYDMNALEARLNKVATRQKLEALADGTAELLNSEEVVRPPTLKKMVEETTERDKTAQNRKIQSLEHRL
jgi:hypothetical protein